MHKKIIICGSGGQGNIYIARLIGKISVSLGMHVKEYIMMGLGQRGGTVLCHITVSDDRIYSPVLKYNSADYMLALNYNEALSCMEYLNNNSTVIMSESKCDIKNDTIKIINFSEESTLQTRDKNIFLSGVLCGNIFLKDNKAKIYSLADSLLESSNAGMQFKKGYEKATE